MELASQVCSLDLAKRLKELGVRQESLFYWVKHRQSAWPEPQIWFCGMVHDFNSSQAPAFQVDKLYSAFTVAELGLLLPFGTDSGRTDYQTLGNPKCFFCAWRKEALTQEKSDIILFADTEANARAKMRIYLIEQGIVKP